MKRLSLPLSNLILCFQFKASCDNTNSIQSMEAQFLHEKDLDKNKGGTRGFDAAKSNEELENILEEKRGDNGGQNGDSKEEEETLGKDKGSGQDGAVDSKDMEVDEIDFGDSKQKSIPKEGN